MFKGAVQSVKLLIAISVAATKMIDYCNIIEKTLFPLQNIEKKLCESTAFHEIDDGFLFKNSLMIHF